MLVPVLLLAACGGSLDRESFVADQRLAYKKQREAEENLEIPPDLMSGSFDDAMDVPPLGGSGSATYSQYVDERTRRRAIAAEGDVLPQVEDVELRREGDIRWLEVDAPPKEVWPRVVSFWREKGILLTEQNPTTGVMKTGWLENRAEIRDDFITNTLRKVVDGLYATSTRDQYRVRLEPGQERATTDVYLTHRGMAERYATNAVGEDTQSVWEPSGSDPGKEAAMLRELMIYLGVTEQRAERLLAQEKERAPKSRLVTGPDGDKALLIADEYRSAWRLTGLALDRVGFAVEDRDRTQGVYYVRYDDPAKGQEKKGFMSKLAFWRGGEIDTVSQYQVRLSAEGEQTRVVVLDQVGRAADDATAERILTLLNEQIR